ncbi:MAG: hypothetical protein JWN66_2626 [Sphingomonas bacterium]|nr:hypothetical protein [Sphingomonas bacterium]
MVKAAPWPLPPRAARSHQGKIAFSDDGLRYVPEAGTAIDLYPDEMRVAQAVARPLSPYFYGTATGMMLALHGLLPIHGSAVEIGGRAVLLCGASGMGKSSFAAALIGHGARLIADDLTALSFDAAGAPCVLPGRTGMRLHRAAAANLGARTGALPPTDEPDGKLWFTPPRIGGRAAAPLDRILILCEDATRPLPRVLASLLVGQLFRRNLLLGLDARDSVYRMLRDLADRVPIARVEGIGGGVPAFLEAARTQWLTEI